MNLPEAKKKEKVYTEKELLFLENLSGPAKGDVKKAMELAGYADSISPSVLRKQLKDEILEIAKNLLASQTIKAVVSLEEVLDAPGAFGASNKVKAAKEILDRAGILHQPDELRLNLGGQGVIILPAKVKPTLLQEFEPVGEIIDVTPERTD